MSYYLGIDFGTSGARAIAIDDNGTIQAEAQYPFAKSAVGIDIAASWQTALFSLIEQIPQAIRAEMKAIAIDGTSSTVLLCDRTGKPITEPLMYNDGRGVEVMDKLKAISPPNHTVLSATSSLAKLLWWQECKEVTYNFFTDAHYFLHQADWLAFLLHGQLGISDYHNALKLGYDVEKLYYPQWLENLALFHLLPKILTPGAAIGEVTIDIANSLGLSKNCLVCAGTTDSIAAFLASGATSPGEAVTSLGSTLVLKLLSSTRVDNAQYGIYSHRLDLTSITQIFPPNESPRPRVSPSPHQPYIANLRDNDTISPPLWLVGGASNTGGAVLKLFFTDAELESLSRNIQPEIESQLDYYPLTKPGERFPINDPHLQPRLEPRPDSPVAFLHGLLESIARIEAQSYQLLQQLGATKLTRVYTAGGGAKNEVWTTIRDRHLKVPILPPLHREAAYGTALLALRGVNN